MRQRCGNPNATAYAAYGGRGIKVCDAWENSFAAFYADMGARPEGTTLDRIDTNGDYAPGNCKWSTPKEQGANRRKYATRSDSKTGLAGLSVEKSGRYNVHVIVEGKRKYIKSTSDFFEACCRLKSAQHQLLKA